MNEAVYFYTGTIIFGTVIFAGGALYKVQTELLIISLLR